ncbi:MAG: putative addiction module antidote protein [Bauldia sp.]|nr:putative addiction module antidote protein [Bauldia sp.]
MPIETTRWDAAESLDTPEAIAAYLEAVFEDGDPQVVARALGDIARAKGISKIARDTGLTRAGLYRALSADGDPRLTTFIGVLKSLGLTVTVRPANPVSS